MACCDMAACNSAQWPCTHCDHRRVDDADVLDPLGRSVAHAVVVVVTLVRGVQCDVVLQLRHHGVAEDKYFPAGSQVLDDSPHKGLLAISALTSSCAGVQHDRHALVHHIGVANEDQRLGV